MKSEINSPGDLLFGYVIFGIPWMCIHAIGLLIYFIRRWNKEIKPTYTKNKLK
jgi:hypothetical protein